jgi:murein DD-endopeptidase MepM/ murein hydrolase activator NlpD
MARRRSRLPLIVAALAALIVLSQLAGARDRPHLPVYGVMGFGFGEPVDYQTCGFHTGQDWFAAPGADIFAIADGTVVYVGPLWLDGPGEGRGPHAIVIDHGGFLTTYSHNSEALVTAGERVARGQHIAELGSEGFSNGPHLHLEKVMPPFTGDWRAPFGGCRAYVNPGDLWGWF